MAEYPLQPGDRPIWLFTLTWAGRVFRWATEKTDVTDANGDELPFTGGLEVEYTAESGMFEDGIVEPQISISNLNMPEGSDVDVPKLVNQGHPLVRASCELSQHVPGDTFEKRKIRLTGLASLTDYGRRGTSLALRIVPVGVSGENLFPTPEMTVNATTWPNFDEPSDGKTYPVPVGKPGFALGGTVTGINGGSPAYVVDTTGNGKLLISGVRVTAATVDVINKTTLVAVANAPVTHEQDGLGRTVAVVADLSGFASRDDDEWWVRWDDAGGGMENPFRDGVLEGAGDVLRHFVALAGARVDTGRIIALSDALNAYKLGFYIDRPTDLWAFVMENLLPLLPVGMVVGGKGAFPVLWRREVHSTETIASVDVFRDGLAQVGPVRYEDGGFGNEQTVSYSPRSDGGKPYKRVSVVGRDVGGDDSTITTTSTARASHATYGPVSADPLETPLVFLASTANLIALWRSEAFAFPHREITYTDPGNKLGWLNAGDAVLLTDDGDPGNSADTGLSFTNRLCWVKTISWDSTMTPTFTFVLIDNPTRDVRPT